MTTIALDAMGGDHAPRAEVEGAILAARELGVRVLLVGIEDTVRQELARHKCADIPIEVVPATDVITMADSPSHAFRRKKESSLHVAARLVRDGKAERSCERRQHRRGDDGGALRDRHVALPWIVPRSLRRFRT
jgi:glycerol-3-phosphate acyltransferase PlsX